MDVHDHHTPEESPFVRADAGEDAHARVVLMPVAYDLTTSYQPGTRHGPRALLEASTHLELYDEELDREPHALGIHVLPVLSAVTASPEAMLERVERLTEDVLAAGKFPFLIGGEHSLTIGTVRALARRHPTLSVLHLDAHADLRDEYMGSRFSHGCVARRLCEAHEVVQIGVRSLSADEARFIEGCERVTTVFDLERDPEAVGRALERLRDPVYITVDFDAFDPAVMPAVGTPEPGGLSWYEALRILRRVFETRRVVGCDVVELCPIPGVVGPDFLAAKLVYKMIGYLQRALEREGAG